MKSALKGELLILFSSFLFAITALLVKFVSSNVDGFFLAFGRFIIGIILCVLFIIILKKGFVINDRKLWVLRGFYGSVAMILYYLSIQITSSGRATLLNLTSPIFVALFGYLFFKEEIKLKHLLSLSLCIIGIIFVYYDGSRYSLLGNTLGVLSGVFAGMAIHYLKLSGEKDNPYMVYLSACVFGLVISVFSIKQASALTVNSALILIFAGITAFIAQMFLTNGYQHVSPTKGSIISTMTVPLALLFSYFFVGEEMKLKFFVGTILILIGLIINRN